MNRLKKMVISFVLPFLCLLVSVSYSVTIEANELYISNSSAFTSSSSSSTQTLEGYTPKNIASAVKSYIVDGDTTVLTPILEDLAFKGYSKSVIHISMNGRNPTYCIKIFPDEFDFDFTHTSSNPVGVNDYIGIYAPSNAYYYSFWEDSNTHWMATVTQSSDSPSYCYNKIISPGILNYSTPFLEFRNISVKSVTYSSDYYIWDGETYFYIAPEVDEPDSPSLPTNSEIAQAVQAFYNSDYYKNNKDFSDFMVLYSYKTGYFSFVGHNFGIDLGQVIVPSNYEYDGYSYNQDWWKFFLRNLSSQIASKLWNKYYWLYTSNDFGETITYDGKGAIGDLIDIHFSTSSTIVYSTTDYPVVKIETDENGVLSPVEGTIPGNQYTYDETLDPTTNEYNPLENFIPTNPTQSILGDVDFNEINKVFEENKNILNIENASWLFTANNKLVGYFTGFLSFLIVLILISRMLGG